MENDFLELLHTVRSPDDRSRRMKWVVHTNRDVVVEFDEANKSSLTDLNELQSFKGSFVSRAILQPLKHLGSIVKFSVFCWVKKLQPLEVLIFEEPLTALYDGCEVLQKKEKQSPLTFTEFTKLWQQGSKIPQLKSHLMKQFVLQIRVVCVLLLAHITVDPADVEKCFQLLEFEFVSDKDFNINLLHIHKDVKPRTRDLFSSQYFT